jgi:hypothetical protein
MADERKKERCCDGCGTGESDEFPAALRVLLGIRFG